MNTLEIKTRLHEEIEHSDDKLLKMIYAIVKEYNEDGGDTIDKRKKLIEEERAKYLRGEEKSYSWDEIKKMVLNKTRPGEL